MTTTLRTKTVAIGVATALAMTALSPAWAAPVLSSKRLYLRDEDHLVCLNLARQ